MWSVDVILSFMKLHLSASTTAERIYQPVAWREKINSSGIKFPIPFTQTKQKVRVWQQHQINNHNNQPHVQQHHHTSPWGKSTVQEHQPQPVTTIVAHQYNSINNYHELRGRSNKHSSIRPRRRRIPPPWRHTSSNTYHHQGGTHQTHTISITIQTDSNQEIVWLQYCTKYNNQLHSYQLHTSPAPWWTRTLRTTVVQSQIQNVVINHAFPSR